MTPEAKAALDSHSWIMEEDSNGIWYSWCSRCKRFQEDCLPNEFHGPIACGTPT